MSTPNDGGPAFPVLEFIRGKIAIAKEAVRYREEAQATWADDDDEGWKLVECKLTKKQRMQVSAKEGRIAEKCRQELAMFREVLALLERSELTAILAELGRAG